VDEGGLNGFLVLLLARKLFNKKTFKQENQKAGLPVFWKAL
jgi:hypothetical protein